MSDPRVPPQGSDDERWLLRAIELSRQAREAGDEPFGSLLVGPDDELLAEALQTVVTDDDVSAHPELKLAVWAARHLGPDVAARTTMYTSCENCAMCAGAMVWSGLGRLVFAMDGAGLARLQGGRPALALPAAEVFARADREIETVGPLLPEEAAAIHEGYWA